ncbi:DNA-directed RNA polymerase sigma-70 factor [Hallella multisaccharivorax DSM 17128]|uniref:RNA polymerase, sigma-24 subunit, ECF subfamily n=1 Tax=Hallella multisaccharivorax DSM 17128 TaxID=688246 RepID=F8N9D5_9BACT|nr:RNA polymerase sigma-70 factor [Hallella multisaccharivorax]EGN57744.1 RNA polymerase, sigma-24 subunit, ECF subfamily [Hallella multisaccharivorax DSM 17128]GJG30995.1 DNA-directed RNA polymerase sigma-70 factor [Hallella multisaccharivorax DSM 17128]
MINKQVINGLRNGSRSHFETIYHLYNGWVYNFVFSLVKDAAVSQDITQDVFLQLWNYREHLEDDNNFEGYLFRITRNMVFQYIRRELLRQQYLKRLAQEKQKTENVEKAIDQSLMEDYILKLTEHLPDARKNILLLYWKSGLTYKEIAERLSISEKTVATQVQRSLKYFKSRMDS